MTYQAPAGRRLAARCPQHAAPIGGSTAVRLHAHRALRLFVTAGAWAAGFCLIVALVALVAEAAGPARAAHVTTAGNYRPPSTAGSIPARGAGHVLRTFSGIGDRTTPPFSVAAHSHWKLQWLYQCVARAAGQRLIIREGDATGSGISVSATGASGHGLASAYAAAPRHYLVVITNCAWTARVLARG
jgi:hypothetical protein